MKKKYRIVFCTYSSIYSSQVLEILLQSEQVKVVGIVNSTRLLKPSYNGFIGSLKFIHATGWRYASYLFLVTDLFRFLQPITRLKSVHSIAKSHQIPLLDTLDINHEKDTRFVEKLEPDVILAAHFNQLIKAPVLRIPRIAAINIHPSLLPDYKGVDPVFYALLRLENRLGVSAHLMDETFDTGDILGQQSFASNTADNVFSHNLQLFQAGAKIALENISKVAARETENTDHNNNEGNYDSWPNKTIMKQFRKQGFCLIRLRDYFRTIRNLSL